MTINVYWDGQTVRLTAEFRVAGALADPSEITWTVTRPDATQETYKLTLGDVDRDSLGVFHVDVETDEAGLWHHRADGDGVEAVAEGSFWVKGSRV